VDFELERGCNMTRQKQSSHLGEKQLK